MIRPESFGIDEEFKNGSEIPKSLGVSHGSPVRPRKLEEFREKFHLQVIIPESAKPKRSSKKVHFLKKIPRHRQLEKASSLPQIPTQSSHVMLPEPICVMEDSIIPSQEEASPSQKADFFGRTPKINNHWSQNDAQVESFCPRMKKDLKKTQSLFDIHSKIPRSFPNEPIPINSSNGSKETSSRGNKPFSKSKIFSSKLTNETMMTPPVQSRSILNQTPSRMSQVSFKICSSGKIQKIIQKEQLMPLKRQMDSVSSIHFPSKSTWSIKTSLIQAAAACPSECVKLLRLAEASQLKPKVSTTF